MVAKSAVKRRSWWIPAPSVPLVVTLVRQNILEVDVICFVNALSSLLNYGCIAIKTLKNVLLA